MNKQDKYIKALEGAVKKVVNKQPLKDKIKKIKDKKRNYNWLAQ